ncbi:nucleoside recognition domain protein (plasmid) [Rhizobium leguminosarum bv. trifolii WSM2304]|uniref:Nucleoside recognition domain protein n=1 Tax=Rhizobium leguminosarum bv. trifolii (strain WSM2304) TaxID=395492 RepID=A0ABF7QZQ7_RHILW|nr:nucleoside recognition domain-containing protein [Rhizobium leguminosarum]ACI59672.1 nucleoside recognition domain protein [Rhizobium leguminosarum bv. trifolii WSM2304]
MRETIELILEAGKSAINLALYTLLPIMIVMTVFLRWLEEKGVIKRLADLLGPILKPFGLTGLSAIALLQVTLVNFAAPIPTLIRMERSEPNERTIAATLAAVLVIAPANGLFPLAFFGIDIGRNLLISAVCAIVASSLCFYGFGRKLDSCGRAVGLAEGEFRQAPSSFLKIIENGGSEAITTVLRLIPLLLLSLAIVGLVQKLGIFEAIANGSRPYLEWVGLSSNVVAPSFIAYIAGSTALIGFYQNLGEASALASDAALGFLVHSMNLVTVAILLSVGPKVARSTPPAIAAGLAGIMLRVLIGWFA